MSLFSQFAAKNAPSAAKKKNPFTLNEVLAIVSMNIEGGLTKEQISQATGRTLNSLNYKIFESKVTIKNKTQVRSIRRFWYNKPNDLNDNSQCSPEEGVKKLFAHYKQPYLGEEDVNERIEKYMADLEAKKNAGEAIGDEAGEADVESDEVLETAV